MYERIDGSRFTFQVSGFKLNLDNDNLKLGT
jgi:hypothetical protein